MTQAFTQSAAPAVSLQALLDGIVAAEALPIAVRTMPVLDLSLDSRAVRPQSAFLAVPGLHCHGIQFAAQAAANGATIILWQPVADAHITPPVIQGVHVIAVQQLSKYLGVLAARFFATAATLNIAAVTGTNGKTTTAYLLAATEAILFPTTAAYMGTLGVGRIESLRTTAHTTPDCITVHRALAALHADGVTHLGMEVSSHALAQHRLDAVQVDTAVFTNLTRDHLDYHGTMEAYGAAKARLFQWPGVRHCVINVADDFGRRLLTTLSHATTTAYSVGPQATQVTADHWLSATQVMPTTAGLTLTLESSWGHAVLQSTLLGAFNAENILAVLAVLLGWGVSLPQAVSALARAPLPPGRMELCAVPDKHVVIDYAHTPDALQKALQALRAHCRGRLLCVFGCGGERDVGKRPLMGAIAEQYADAVIVTDDNPRHEAAEDIVADILRGMRRPYAAQVIHDRAAAIGTALTMAAADDWILLAGKGHETYQVIGTTMQPFSDRVAVQQAMQGAT